MEQKFPHIRDGFFRETEFVWTGWRSGPREEPRLGSGERAPVAWLLVHRHTVSYIISNTCTL